MKKLLTVKRLRRKPSRSSQSALPTSQENATRKSQIPDEEPRQQYNKRFTLSSYYREGHWFSEVVSLVLSALVTALIAAVLAAYSGRPVSSWNAPITLNALVSLLVTVLYMLLSTSVSSCISQLKWNLYHDPSGKPLYRFQQYDKASRNILGALALLVGGPGSFKAAVACVLSLSIAAVGPLVQQIIGFGEQESVTDGTATIPSSHYYRDGWSYTGSEIQHDPTDLTNTSHHDGLQMKWGITSAIIESVYAPFTIDNTSEASCSGSRCSWDPYVTLAIQSQCVNLTDHIQLHNPQQSTPVRTSDSPSTLASLENGFSMTSALIENMATRFNLGGVMHWEEIYHAISSTNMDPLLIPDRPGTLLNMQIILLETTGDIKQRNVTENYSVWDILDIKFNKYSAWECVLELDAKAFTATKMNNITIETSTTVSSPVLGNVTSPSPRRLLHWDFTDPDANTSARYTPNISYLSSYKSSEAWLADLPQFTDYQVTLGWRSPYFRWHDIVLEIENATAVALAWSLATSFQGNYTYSWYGMDIPPDQPLDKPMMAIGPMLKAEVDRIKNHTAPGFSLPDLMANVATGMTKYIRSANGSVAYGQAFSFQTTYDVRWGWISIPVSLVVVSAGLLTLTVLDTRRRGISVWTDSALAVMAHGVDDYTRYDVSGCTELSALNARARGIYVRLGEDHSLSRA